MIKLKRLLVVLFVCLLLSNYSFVSFADSIKWHKYDDLLWNISSNGTLTISGSGPMYGTGKEERPEEYPWLESSNSIKTLIIEDGITEIAFSAFENCENLTIINLPNSLTRIGSDAFYNTGYYNNSQNWKNGALYMFLRTVTGKNA